MQAVDVAIVGGGIIGCSVAYHLQQAGVRRVALIEAADDLATQTSAAGAGFVSAWMLAYDDPSRESELQLERYAMEFYPALERATGADIGLRCVGMMEVGAGLNDSEKLFARGLGLPASDLLAWRRVETAELLRRVPILDPRFIQQVIFVPYAFRVSLPRAVRALATAFARAGGTIHLGTRVTSVQTRGGRVTGLQTTRGPIDTPIVINAAGAWAMELARMVGLELPMRWYSATRCVTEPLGLAPDMPLLILHYADDKVVYAREDDGGLLFGHLKLLPEYERRPAHPARSPHTFRPEHFAQLPHETAWMFPVVKNTPLRSFSRGFPTRPPDDRHYLGESPVQGFYLAAGCCEEGATHGPGLGRVMTELILTGKAFVDVRPWRPDRFGYGKIP